MGITEMMDFFRDFYGIRYAPNTRETVRRQTVHQFMQVGLAVANPDNPSRPINSPKTKYQSNFLQTSPYLWNGCLESSLQYVSSKSSATLHLKRTEMA
jgi:hypothetical protein